MTIYSMLVPAKQLFLIIFIPSFIVNIFLQPIDYNYRNFDYTNVYCAISGKLIVKLTIVLVENALLSIVSILLGKFI